MIRIFLAKALAFLHLFSILFLVFGFLLPKPFLIYHATLILLTIFQWKMNNNQCLLTQWQHFLENNKDDKKLQGAFTEALFHRLGLKLNPSQLFFVIYGILLTSFGLTIFRLYVLSIS